MLVIITHQQEMVLNALHIHQMIYAIIIVMKKIGHKILSVVVLVYVTYIVQEKIVFKDQQLMHEMQVY